MKVYQDLIVRGRTEQITTFFRKMREACNRWQVDDSLSSDRQLAFRVPADAGHPETTLYLQRTTETQCSVGNIIPANKELSLSEYNRILQDLYEACIQGMAIECGVQAELTKEDVDIEEMLSLQSRFLLRVFAIGANKKTGSHHPADYRRWIDFLAASISNNEQLTSDFLQMWLEQQGFPEDVATDLSGEYQFARDVVERTRSLPHAQDVSHAA